jgi:glyoxylase-like metal-dependent hydrolase (beta-lactamase superfamily II)
MTMLAETVDAVIGIDTHRDTHEVEIADAAGRPIAVLRIGNNSAGFEQLLAAIAEVAPGPRVAVCIEGSRSYGIGLARAPAAAGLLVLECEQPRHKQRRGKGKSDPIDAYKAVLAAMRLDADKLPVPRADGDREALRILLVARQEITEASTAQASRLRALLLAGDDADRRAARAAGALAGLGLVPGDIDLVINTHLHFDHCGQNAVFKHAAFCVQRAELDRCRRESPALYDWFDFQNASFELLDGDAEIRPGLSVITTPGHTSGHQSVRAAAEDGGADLLIGDAAYTPRQYRPEPGRLPPARPPTRTPGTPR